MPKDVSDSSSPRKLLRAGFFPLCTLTTRRKCRGVRRAPQLERVSVCWLPSKGGDPRQLHLPFRIEPSCSVAIAIGRGFKVRELRGVTRPPFDWERWEKDQGELGREVHDLFLQLRGGR